MRKKGWDFQCKLHQWGSKSLKVVKEADNLQIKQINYEMGNSGLESSPWQTCSSIFEHKWWQKHQNKASITLQVAIKFYATISILREFSYAACILNGKVLSAYKVFRCVYMPLVHIIQTLETPLHNEFKPFIEILSNLSGCSTCA